MTHPLGLSDTQLRLVMDAARQVPAEWRRRFLDGVIDRLLPLNRVTTEEVQHAVSQVLHRIGVAA